jgi:alpha-tubulin suppressor-like RCC1 family protein
MNNVTQVSAGLTHSCALRTDGTAACWGDDSSGQLGDGAYTTHAFPKRVNWSVTGELMDHLVQIVAASGFTCAVRDDETAWCWGQNGVGKLGNGKVGIDAPYPVRVAIDKPVKAISAIGESACALLDTPQRSVRCWGNNDDGQLGDGTKTDRATPVDVVISERDGSMKLLTDVKQISMGSDHACATLIDSTVACWGFNWTGELGNGTFTESLSPTGVIISGGSYPKLSGITQVTANGLHSCAKFAATWQLACWGNNSQGQLGDPAVTAVTASPVGVAVGVQSVGAGSESTCALLADYRIGCWGGNSYGQLGDGTTTGSRTPLILPITKATSLSVGDYHACVVLPDTTVECWGRGREGQLGNGLFDEKKPTPQLVHDIDG